MRPLHSSLLTSWAVAGFLLAGFAAFAQHGSITSGHGSFGGGVHSGFAGHAGGIDARGFNGPVFGNPGRISTLAPHAISMPGRAVFPPSPRGFSAGFAPNWTRSQRAWRNGGWRDGGHRHDHDRRYEYGAYGYPGGYYANSWELLPYDLGYSDFMGDDAEQPADQQGSAPPTESAPPPDSSYRPAYSGNEQESYPMQQAWAASSAPSAPIPPEPELTLIFKDGHTQAIHNYVLTPSDLVVLDQAATGRQQQIPLDELNLPATEKAAQQAGVDFSPPA